MLDRFIQNLTMKKEKTGFCKFVRLNNISLLYLILLISLLGCQKDKFEKILDSGNYSGTFESETIPYITNDSVYLNISNGFYYCYTNLPYNYGAGKVEISETKVNFIDTLFFTIPALYISGFALSGEFMYQYDGDNLILEQITDYKGLTYRMKRDN